MTLPILTCLARIDWALPAITCIGLGIGGALVGSLVRYWWDHGHRREALRAKTQCFYNVYSMCGRGDPQEPALFGIDWTLPALDWALAGHWRGIGGHRRGIGETCQVFLCKRSVF